MPPNLVMIANRFDDRRRKMKRQAFVAAGHMIVQADIFVARPPDEHRSGDQIVSPPTAAAAETTPTDIRYGIVPVQFGVRPVGGAGVAPIVECRDRSTVQ